jgi:cyclophilin family peptidyl-prolyl cis-trans isomerase
MQFARRAAVLGGCLVLGIFMTACSQMKTEKKDSTTAKGDTTVKSGGTFAVIETSMGTIEIELYSEDAPKTVANFVGLAEEKYYDGVIFHRVSRNFVIQGGDPTGKGTGGKSIYGKPYDDELNPATASWKAGYLKGVLAMAHPPRPNSNTSQFFIMLDDVRSLPKEYTIFGKVVKGIEVVDAIGLVDITPEMGPTDGRPKTPVVMKSVTIRREPAAGVK